MRGFFRIPDRLAGMARGLRDLPLLLRHLKVVEKECKSLRKQLHEMERDLERIKESAGQILGGQAKDRKWRIGLHHRVNALLRMQYLDLADNVAARRFQLMSQNEEDGIVLALLKEAGAATRTFVDIGCGGIGGNSGVLAYELGWAGMMVDADQERIDEVKERFAHNPRVEAVCCMVSPENVNEILQRHRLQEPDFFSLDIDSYDYWVFQALECRPRVVALEYNALFGREPVTVPFGGIPKDAPKGYHGASLKALTRIASQKGYKLICCENSGVNAFYLREDLRPDIQPVDPDVAFRPLRSRKDLAGQELRDRDVLGQARDAGLELLHV